MSSNPLQRLAEFGQSVWYDNLHRDMLEDGELARMISDDGLRGVTSNPTIFDKAISGSPAYDGDIAAALREDPERDAEALFNHLAVTDIRRAADTLRPVFDATEGVDGLVSMEVSPRLAHDTEGTIAEARRLWQWIDRPNLMVKVPATVEGVPAIEALIAEGINVNVTLLFSVPRYEAVFEAFVRGLAQNDRPRDVASVASFFISRIDGVIDSNLDEVGTPEARALRSRAAIANARLAYRAFGALRQGEAFRAQAQRGARVQRPLWASTSTKDPNLSDVYYIEALIGPDTVNTIPPKTLDAMIEHGSDHPHLAEEIDDADRVMKGIQQQGVSIDAVAAHLEADGVHKFVTSHDALISDLEAKIAEVTQRYAVES